MASANMRVLIIEKGGEQVSTGLGQRVFLISIEGFSKSELFLVYFCVESGKAGERKIVKLVIRK